MVRILYNFLVMILTLLLDYTCYVSVNHFSGATSVAWNFILVLTHLLVPSYWQWNLSFKTGYLSLLPFMTPLTFEIAIILILKHAASLCLSGTSARTAISQAESNFQNANVGSKIKEHFTGSYEEYTIGQFVHFIVNTNFGLSSLITT